MKIQCDACERAVATIICCADEAALCAACDVQVHAANKLASKHQRLHLDCLSNKLPRCDICQDKPAFIFCVEDRALFCMECDKSVHVPGTLSGNHRRLLATGIRVALAAAVCTDKASPTGPTEPPTQRSKPRPPAAAKAPEVAPPHSPSSWSAVEDFLQLSDYESGDKRKSPVGLGEMEWLEDIGLFPDTVPESALTMADVPEQSFSTLNTFTFYKSHRSTPSYKKPMVEIDDVDELFKVPDLG